MGTTEEKARAALASRVAVRDAIATKGGTITNTTPFADYADAVNTIPTGTTIPETTADTGDVILGKTFVRNIDGEPVQRTGTLAEADVFYESGRDIICGKSGVVLYGQTVHSLGATASFVQSPTDNDGVYIVCSTSGYTGAGTTVTHVQQATFTNPEDGYIRCSNAGYTATGVILSMQEPGNWYVETDNAGATVRCATAGWFGTYTTSLQIPLAAFTENTSSSGADIVCSNAGYTAAGATVTHFNAATMTMDYSSGTVYSGTGYANGDYLTINAATMTLDYSAGTVYSGNGFANGETLELGAGTLIATGGTVYATQGWQDGTQQTAVQTGTITDQGSYYDVTEGYVQAGTYSKGGGYPVPNGAWTTMTKDNTYYAGQYGAFVKFGIVMSAAGNTIYFYLFANGTEIAHFDFNSVEGDININNVVMYIPPNSSFYCNMFSSAITAEYCDATMQA